MSSKLNRRLIAFAVAIACSNSYALKLEDAVAKTVVEHPDVRAKWHEFAAAGYERDISWGRYLPTLDVVYGLARERTQSPTIDERFTVTNGSATVKQNVFEGFGTSNDVLRLEHAQLVRFYESLEMSELAAVEAAKAYIDVFRFQKLVQMAQENMATHRAVYDKINERVKSGVSRGVDLEMASGRLALAESNLLTEDSNLHDVTARYQRIVGVLPQGELEAIPPLSKGLPKTRDEAVKRGFETSPQLKASAENFLSSKRQIAVQRAGYMPRADLFANASRERNSGGVEGKTKTETYGATADWNLFRGFQDDARVGKASEESEAARSLRDRVCRDVRQSLATAFNDYLRLSEQLNYLDQHQLSTDKAREALRKQFDIGQRTLLDVLDTENEFYTARRNYFNGEMDLSIAQAKFLASSGTLINTLNVRRMDMTPPTPEVSDEERNAIATAQCPPTAAEFPATNKDAVFQRTKAREDMMRGQAPAPQRQ